MIYIIIFIQLHSKQLSKQVKTDLIKKITGVKCFFCIHAEQFFSFFFFLHMKNKRKIHRPTLQNGHFDIMLCVGYLSIQTRKRVQFSPRALSMCMAARFGSGVCAQKTEPNRALFFCRHSYALLILQDFLTFYETCSAVQPVCRWVDQRVTVHMCAVRIYHKRRTSVLTGSLPKSSLSNIFIR